MPKSQNEGKNGPDVVIIIVTDDGQEARVTVDVKEKAPKPKEPPVEAAPDERPDAPGGPRQCA